MKVFSGPYVAQGDLNIFKVESIPSQLPTAQPGQDGQFTLAHSETGHCRVIDGNAVRVYDADEFVSYLDVEKGSRITHLRSFDRHETISLPPGNYMVTRQREYTPEGFRRAAD